MMQKGDYDRKALEKLQKYSQKEILAALVVIVKKWRDGDLKVGDKTYKNETEGKIVLKYLCGLTVSKEQSHHEEHTDSDIVTKLLDDLCLTEDYDALAEHPDIETVVELLLDLSVAEHYDIVASHRQAVKKSAEYCTECKVAGSKIIQHSNGYPEHDLSKYGPEEAIGYAVMFGRTRSFQVLDDFANDVWKRSLNHHYENNPHHPEYYNGKDMTEEYLLESTVDMLGCRLERDFKWEKTSEIAVMDEKFLKRYTSDDHKKVTEFLKNWQEKLKEHFGK